MSKHADSHVTDAGTRAIGTEIITLLPRDLILDEHTDVRPWESSNNDAETERIQRLAATIKEEGQLQPVVAREITAADGSITYHLIAGRRRRAAIDLINQERAQTKQEFLPVNVSVLRDISDDSAFRKAMMENAQRLQMSPMDMALNIRQIITRHNWEEKKNWSARVADFLGVSRGFVTQKMKLFDLPDSVQAEIHSGDLSEKAAWAAIKVKPEMREEIIADAGKIAADEAAQGTTQESESVDATATEGETADATATTETAAPADPGKVTDEHVMKAARAKDALNVITPLSRKEIVEAITQFDSSVYGHKNGATRKFVSYFVDTYVKGAGSPTMFKRLFNKMVEGADQGTPEPEVEKAPKATAKAVAPAKATAGKKAVAETPAKGKSKKAA